MAIIFLTGMLLPAQKLAVEQNSFVYVENAANVLQKGFLRGIAENTSRRLCVVNLPFIAPYPQGYKKSIFSGLGDTTLLGVDVIEPSFLNIRFLRIASRFLGALNGLGRINDPQADIVIYSLHLPFISAAVLWKVLHPKTRICLIVPDLPEFFGEAISTWRRLVLGLQTRVFKRLRNKIDTFVVLTSAMKGPLGARDDQTAIVEGIADPEVYSVDDEAPLDTETRIFLYTGALERRYGLNDLLDAFSQVDDASIRLWICGSGSASADVQSAADSDARISYFGLVTQEEARKRQRFATVLVNPRPPFGEFTKYSFPSKTMEYLAAGKPVLMHWLPGIPEEYLEFLHVPNTPDCVGLANCIRSMVELSSSELIAIGKRNRQFVLKKTPKQQCERVVALIEQQRDLAQTND